FPIKYTLMPLVPCVDDKLKFILIHVSAALIIPLSSAAIKTPSNKTIYESRIVFCCFCCFCCFCISAIFSTPLNQLCPFICMIIFRHMFFLPFPFYTKIKSASRNEKADCSIVLCFYFFSNFNFTFCLLFIRCCYFFGQSTLYCCCRGTIRVTS